jgi:signal transduction histidine kinase
MGGLLGPSFSSLAQLPASMGLRIFIWPKNSRALQFSRSITPGSFLKLSAPSKPVKYLQLFLTILENPLNTSGLVANVLRETEQMQKAQIVEFVAKIQRAFNQMLRLISDLLDFSKIQSGTFSVEPYAGTLESMIRPVIEGMKTLAEARQQTIECHIESDLPEVAADGHRVGQVVSNLLSNAIKFTRQGGTIVVSARQRDNTIVVSVSDEGPGIRQEDISRVFDRFWQARETRRMGSGLGLSIAKGIVEAHSGKIWVESASGKGSSFFFTLPLATPDANPGNMLPARPAYQ